MNKVMMVLIAVITMGCYPIYAGDLGLDFKVSLDDRGGVEARVGMDVLALLDDSKTGATAVDPESLGSAVKDEGFFKGIGSWISQNPWKAAGITALVLGGSYAAYANNKGGGSDGHDHTAHSHSGDGDNRGNDTSVCNFQNATINAAVHCENKSESAEE